MTNNKDDMIIEAIKETNKWWRDGFRAEYNDREIYNEIRKFIETKQILAFTGLRRVGKTVIMLKIVNDKLTQGFDAKNIVYFSFDDFRDVRINDVINNYAKIMNRNMEHGKFLFLLDEIQKIKGWEEQIKRIYDNHGNFKIIISGSESLFIRKKSRESLAGRFFEFKISQLSFKEYLDFKGTYKHIGINNFELYKEELNRAYLDYIFCNGFPEIINEGKEVIKKYIKEDIIEKITYRDIPQIFAVRDVGILENIFNIILQDPGQIINIDDLSKSLNIARQTLSIYLDYLEKSFLIKKVYNFSKNIRKTERKLKKYYPTIILPKLIEDGNFGKVYETAAILHLDAEFFWRDAYKHEVDIVLAKEKIIPIEIKSGDNFDTKSLFIFMKKFKLNNGFILTANKDDIINNQEKTVIVSPICKFLLMQSEDK